MCKGWNEAVDCWAIPLLIGGYSPAARSLEIGEGAPKKSKCSRQENGRNCNNFIPTFTEKGWNTSGYKK